MSLEQSRSVYVRAVRMVNGRSYRKFSIILSVHSRAIIGTGRELLTYASYIEVICCISVKAGKRKIQEE